MAWASEAVIYSARRVPAPRQELIEPDAELPFSGNLAHLVLARYQDRTLEQNVCEQLLLSWVRRNTRFLASEISRSEKPPICCVVRVTESLRQTRGHVPRLPGLGPQCDG